VSTELTSGALLKVGPGFQTYLIMAGVQQTVTDKLKVFTCYHNAIFVLNIPAGELNIFTLH